MATGTTSTTSQALSQYWHKFFIENLYANRVMSGLTKTAQVPSQAGKTVWWVGISKINPAGASGTEGSDPTARSTAATRVSGTLAEYNNLAKNSRLFMETVIEGTREQILMDLAQDAGKTLDDQVLSKALGGSNVVYAQGKLHRSSIIEATTATIADIRKAVTYLKNSSVPRFPDGFYVAVAHPEVIHDLQSDSAWQDFVKYRDTVKYDIPNEAGRIWGCRFVEAPTIPILVNSGSANTDIYRTLIMGPGYVGQSELGDLQVAINEPGKTTELGMFDTYGYRFVLATERLHEARCVRVESNATLA